MISSSEKPNTIVMRAYGAMFALYGWSIAP